MHQHQRNHQLEQQGCQHGMEAIPRPRRPRPQEAAPSTAWPATTTIATTTSSSSSSSGRGRIMPTGHSAAANTLTTWSHVSITCTVMATAMTVHRIVRAVMMVTITIEIIIVSVMKAGGSKAAAKGISAPTVITTTTARGGLISASTSQPLQLPRMSIGHRGQASATACAATTTIIVNRSTDSLHRAIAKPPQHQRKHRPLLQQ